MEVKPRVMKIISIIIIIIIKIIILRVFKEKAVSLCRLYGLEKEFDMLTGKPYGMYWECMKWVALC